ncbi:hypothetical protein BKA60DRAFT_579409 [Fusarium oxysporum]|nr:hypothetical protein BKA60DRAFT_579409 [Fusarium oxysporum]
MEVGIGPTYITLPSQPAEFKNLANSEILQNILPSIMGDKKLNRRPYNRRRSQVEKVLSETSVFQPKRLIYAI